MLCKVYRFCNAAFSAACGFAEHRSCGAQRGFYHEALTDFLLELSGTLQVCFLIIRQAQVNRFRAVFVVSCCRIQFALKLSPQDPALSRWKAA
jgi:hypothetical protein